MGEKYSIVWQGTSIKHADDKMYYDLLFVFWLLEGVLLVSQAVLKSSAFNTFNTNYIICENDENFKLPFSKEQNFCERK